MANYGSVYTALYGKPKFSDLEAETKHCAGKRDGLPCYAWADREVKVGPVRVPLCSRCEGVARKALVA
jgi:hypothetical protein